jgi:hypothetical protein
MHVMIWCYNIPAIRSLIAWRFGSSREGARSQSPSHRSISSSRDIDETGGTSTSNRQKESGIEKIGVNLSTYDEV